jgi:hypothetical protein
MQALKDVRGLPLSEVLKWLPSATSPEIEQLAKEAGIAESGLRESLRTGAFLSLWPRTERNPIVWHCLLSR